MGGQLHLSQGPTIEIFCVPKQTNLKSGGGIDWNRNWQRHEELGVLKNSQIILDDWTTFEIIMHLSMSSRRGGKRGIGRGFDLSLWPGGRAFELSCCPVVGIFELLFLPVTTNHFLGWGISVIFDLTFLPGDREFHSNFLENVKITPYGRPPPLPRPAWHW